MRPPVPPAFRSNENKDYLRSTYDRGIIANWCLRRKALLHYLGLPGPEMLDLIAWQDYIDQFTTIERRANEQHLMFLRAHVRDVEHRLHSLYGEFDQILLSGRDKYNITPRWPYDLVNLDHFGGFLYQDLSRPKALEKLINNQGEYRRSFLLIVTHDLRDGDSVGEKESFFHDLGRALERDYSSSGVIQAYIERYQGQVTPDAARQALYMNCFLRDYGEVAHFDVFSRTPIVYIGTGGTKMIHYISEFDYRPSGHRAASHQSLRQVLNLGLHELRQGRFTPVEVPLLPDLGHA
jgi:hypothetical protein